MSRERFDLLIIGAGMAGVAAGIRAGMAGKSVLLVEKHEAPGGLNSYYAKDGRVHDVGLHALTNFARPTEKGAPLNKIFRQLRIRREDFDLSEQIRSRIAFPGRCLTFSNEFSLLESEVAREFPAEIDGFRRMVEAVRGREATALEDRGESARKFIRTFLHDRVLEDMLLCPVMYYGSPTEEDLDLDQFVILFRSLYLEGFARPLGGVRSIIRPLLRRLKEVGVQRRMRCGVKRLLPGADGNIREVELENGTVVEAAKIISTAGLVETARLCGAGPAADDPVGRLSFVETISIVDAPPRDLGWQDTIVFFSTNEEFSYRCPRELVDPSSGVICVPNNYAYPDGRNLPEGIIRLTAMANYEGWRGLSAEDYRQAKDRWFARLATVSRQVVGASREPETVAADMFTPLTIEKFTGHFGGAVYGASRKSKDGRTAYNNLFLAGTDQGFLGIVGAILSGISITNRWVIQE